MPALFPELEALLEAEHWLTDVSDILASDSDDPAELMNKVRPGSIIDPHQGQLVS